ncbi:uncharacterized protein LOC114322241 [Camellia sinensis]|uniref:uncharacterized protein LOC114322241 n=1 Tax=Camellia sinensis TaxID=4442 RepID=UPI001035F1BE|nr:uncharacterized protein LOC114322241 [Camellia sinensis]
MGSEERERLWRRVVVAKFGLGRGEWCSSTVGLSHGCGVWKGIWLGREAFWRRVRLKVGVGDRVRFWRDRWCGDLSLEFKFPLIFAIAADLEVLVAAVKFGEGQSTVWNVQLRRNVQDLEQDQLVELLDFLYGSNFVREGQDSLVWDCPRSKDIFTVSSFYGRLVQDGFAQDVARVYPWSGVWLSGSPSKVAFFVWSASLGGVLTIDNLIHQGHILVNWCCLCGRAAESVDHLLMLCPVSSRLWMLMIAVFGLVWVQSGSVLTVVQSWAGGRVGRRRRKAWLLAAHCLMWIIWLERNRRVFHGVAHSISWLERRLLIVLYSWVDPDVLAFVDFVEDLTC